MHRRTPQSGKAKKEKLQAQRAFKSSAQEPNESSFPPTDVIPVPSPIKPNKSIRPLAGRQGISLEDQRRTEARKSARSALESRFIKLSPAVQEHYKTVLAKKPFDRPINDERGCLTAGDTGGPLEQEHALLCPKRPKWKYYMLKKEVEKVEQADWMKSTIYFSDECCYA